MFCAPKVTTLPALTVLTNECLSLVPESAVPLVCHVLLYSGRGLEALPLLIAPEAHVTLPHLAAKNRTTVYTCDPGPPGGTKQNYTHVTLAHLAAQNRTIHM